MGTTTDLSVAGYPLLETKSTVIPEVMTVFRESDRRVFIRGDAMQEIPPGVEPGTDDYVERAIVYGCETGNVIERLDVMGFTLRRVREDFEAVRLEEIKKFESWAEDESPSDWFSEEWQFLKQLTFEDYVAGLREVIGKKYMPWDEPEKKIALSPVEKYILEENEDYPWYGYLGSDVRSLLRVACHVVDPKTNVEQDVTGVVSAGYYGADEPICENAITALTAGHPENANRIILTEGSSDSAILKAALELLYPHLAGYYSFLDFESSRSQGGAGHLASIVKAFAAAGISNRVIALFDNDTAGREARRSLATIALPRNIVVLAHPDLESLQSYPTLGPGGTATLDVNGLAGSIELYLGDDVLSENGAKTPIQWKGYNEVLKAYQGEVMNKGRLQAAFQRKVDRCRGDRNALTTADWTGLRAILDAIFRAFP